MELFFLIILVVLMGAALGSGFPVAFALPGSAIITIGAAAFTGFLFEGDSSAYFHSSGPYECGCLQGSQICGQFIGSLSEIRLLQFRYLFLWV